MEVQTLRELSVYFTEKLSQLTQSAAIQASIRSSEDGDEEAWAESCQPLQSLWESVDELSDILSLARSKCHDQRQRLADVQEVKRKLASLMKSVQYTSNNLPPHLPTLCSASAHGCQTSHQNGAGQKRNSPMAPPPQSQGRAGNMGGANSNDGVSAKTTPALHTVASKGPSLPCPLVEYLTVEEFTSIPKYMKGRLSYQQVNTVIDELNKAFVAKYKLLRQKKSTMSDLHRKRYEALKMQECKETKGIYFLVEKDIKEWSGLKMSKETHTVFTMLRHCGRLCEIRSQGLIRYALIEMY